mgnify:CR=1 FL=1
MEKIISALNELEEINKTYHISTEEIDSLKQKIETSKVCVPIIGKFSSGKSALVNAILVDSKGKKILKEDITPETAIPAEIVYGNDENVSIIKNDGSVKNILVEEYRNYVADANLAKCARIQLNNSFLKEIPDVMLVDMPGFESTFDLHDKVIDDYLPQSLAYIIAFPADDMIIRDSIANILKELCLHDMPICVVITKYDKRNHEFEETFSKLKENLKKYITNREIYFCKTSNVDKNVKELEDFLISIQEKSQIIISRKFLPKVSLELEITEGYLNTTLKSSQLSESELDEQEERLKKQIADLEDKFNKEQDNFIVEISDCVEQIKSDILIALESEESTFVAMAMNKQDIREHLNSLVRRTITISIKKNFIPKIQKYLKRVNNCIESENIADIRTSFSFDIENSNSENSNSESLQMTNFSIATLVTGLLKNIPIVGQIATFVIPIIDGILSFLFGGVSGGSTTNRREDAKEKIRTKLRTEIFPQITREVGDRVEIAINKQVSLINQSIEEETKAQEEVHKKAIADLREKINIEKAEKEKLMSDIQKDLKKIGEIRNGL